LPVNGGNKILVRKSRVRFFQPDQTNQPADKTTGGDNKEKLVGIDKGINGQIKHGANVTVSPRHTGNLTGYTPLNRCNNTESSSLRALYKKRGKHGNGYRNKQWPGGIH